MTEACVTEVEQLLHGLYAERGTIPLDEYMTLCLAHPQHGYYMSSDPFGEAGDFITSPEITPLFGELIGVWAASVYDAMGRPPRIQLIELGPGRGTLMADVLKAARVLPWFAAALEPHLVEISPTLRQMQRWKLGAGAQWHESLSTVPDGPSLIIANEFFDALPIRQMQRRSGRWWERMMGPNGFALKPCDTWSASAAEGEIVELSPAREQVARDVGQRLKRCGGAALVIDYGHLRSCAGDTLQALHRHHKVPVTHLPGKSDITSHVDFQALAAGFERGGAKVARPMTQREFLLAMGIEIRVAVLAERGDVASVRLLNKAVTRLIAPEQMGELFKVLAVLSPDMKIPYPFGAL